MQAGLPLNGSDAKASMVHWRMARSSLITRPAQALAEAVV
jgi:hypothetical protein